MIINNNLEQFDSMYPSAGYLIDNDSFVLPSFCRFCSVYGYSYGQSKLEVDGYTVTLDKGQFFSLPVKEGFSAFTKDKLFVVVRLGYLATKNIGWVEKKGRLSYIDGCSDSLLVYPSRLGDSSLNLLYFPTGINQSFHTHPSIRLGCVIQGGGVSSHGNPGDEIEDLLNEGTAFCLREQERHRFRTTDQTMTIVAFHPDGDWGPTDHNHTMLNRTYIKK